ncbi:unnamed protein product [Cunninghamella echinulata]
MTSITEDSLENIVNIIELLQSLYYDDEFKFRSNEDDKLYQQILQYSQENELSALIPTLQATSLSFRIHLPLNKDNDMDQELLVLTIDGRLSLSQKQQNCQWNISSSENNWLDRELHESFNNTWSQYWKEQLEQESELDLSTHIMLILQHASILALPIIEQYQQQQKDLLLLQQQKSLKVNQGPIIFLREWLWLPMIYTKEKRNHIVDWAPSYNITGRLFSGKPGMLCLESTSENVAKFINDIKTISWADIPSGHKKISTKYQERIECETMEELDQHRKFRDMEELKFETSGKFRNHNDLDALKKYMTEHQVGDAFSYLFDYE